jgi:hypothetical protein
MGNKICSTGLIGATAEMGGDEFSKELKAATTSAVLT